MKDLWFKLILTTKSTKNFWLKIIVTIVPLFFILIRLLWPSVKIDAITLGLLIVAILPWLSSLIKSAEFPGGWKVEFRDLEAAAQKITELNTYSDELTTSTTPSFHELLDKDPNLALVQLRIEIEKRVKALVQKHNISEKRSLIHMLGALHKNDVLDVTTTVGLSELIIAGNDAVHGASVDRKVTSWAINYAPRILYFLDRKIEELS